MPTLTPRPLAFLVAALLLFPSLVRAQEILLREGQAEPAQGTFVVPFVFSSSSSGASAGVSVANRGWLQPQASVIATAVGSVSGTAYGFLALRNLEVAALDRVFINGQLNLGTFSEIDIYQDGNPAFAGETAGRHGSDADNFITGDGTDVKAWTSFNLVLPIGAGVAGSKSRLTLRDGLVTDGRDTSFWNPLRGGYTLVGVKPFYRSQDIDTDEAGARESTTSGSEFLLHHQNTDFSENPSRGSVQQLRYTRDWGELDSTAPWETVDFLAAKYIPLGAGARSRQRVLALNLWWLDTPSWDDTGTEDGAAVAHRPPAYAGASLGGMERMKGYPEGRFHDRSAAYYTAEYRHIPDWNPLRDIGWMNRLNIRVDWLQLVAGVEAGRVAGEFDFGELHRDMNVSGLLGLRAMVNHLVVRADMGVSDEGVQVQMTIDQPF